VGALAKVYICRGCLLPNTDGPLCFTCNSGLAVARHNPAYDSPDWRRLSRRAIASHRAVYGNRCLTCTRRITATNPLTADHPLALADGGALLQPPVVMCRACNSSKGGGRRQRRARHSRSGKTGVGYISRAVR